MDTLPSVQQKFANINSVKNYSDDFIRRSFDVGLMHQFINSRNGKLISYRDKRDIVEFLNCSYLGLDIHPRLTESATTLLNTWGAHMGCVRTRFSIAPHGELEEKLGSLFKGHAITFASVSSTHLSVLPLVASGMVLREGVTRPLLVFDKLAHSSMQCLKPIAAQYADIETIGNNDLNALEDLLKKARLKGQTTVFITDSVFSMGGLPPLKEMRDLSDKYDLYLYLDDAHGTSVFGEHGEGFVIDQYGELPEKTILLFSLSKAFGCNGGGVAFPTAEQKRLTRYYSQIYTFSSALPWGMIGAALGSIELHLDGTVRDRQKQLKTNIDLFCTEMGIRIKEHMSPVQGLHIGDPDKAISIGEELINNGYYAPCVFFPVVPKDHARIRVCLSALHTPDQLKGFAKTLKTAIRNQGLDVTPI